MKKSFSRISRIGFVRASGQAVYTSMVSLQNGLSQQFDFSRLGTGTYPLTLTTGNETLTRAFVVQANPNESFVVQ